MVDTTDWIRAVRASHDRFTELVRPLSATETEQPSYATDWSIAQTASHLGSQAEIFSLFLQAGLNGQLTPGPAEFGPIWDRWNALAPAQQVQQSVIANEALVTQVEQVTSDERDRFTLSMFGMDLDFAGLLWMRLGEHALHTWDVAVALDESATVSADAVELLVDGLAALVGRAAQPAPGQPPVGIVTTDPSRSFRLTLDPEVALQPSDATAPDALTLPAEALIRLVYGRLDPDHTPAEVGDERLAALRSAFPGF